MFKTRLFALAALAGVAGILSAMPANALDRRVRIYNNTSYTMTEFHASNIDRPDWGHDRFGLDTLDPGNSTVLNISDGNGYCRFDLRATFDDGTTVIRNNFNVCSEAEWGVSQRRSRLNSGVVLVGQ